LDFDELDNTFTIPEKTKSGYGFADIPQPITLDKAKAVFYGVPLDLTTTFGKGTARGPEAIRTTSALQTETYVFDEKVDIYDRIGIYDLGDIKIPRTKLDKKKSHIESVFRYLDEKIGSVCKAALDMNKIPVLLGGEHTVSYFQIKEISKENPIVIHFDAHRDMKEEYGGLKLCHTTPFYYLIKEGHVSSENLVQIGIRQADSRENEAAKSFGVTTFSAWDVHDRINDLLRHVKKITENRSIYISFDIDVYDLPYVPCTGTPEPFGLDPFQIARIIKSISDSSTLIGLDLVEVGLKNNDYREGVLSTQTLFRILAHRYKTTR
jgi:agmatinase